MQAPFAEDGGAGGTRTPDPLHAMQVLSQLSYNPTCFASVHSLAWISDATRPDSSPGCSTGEFRAPPTPGLHRSRLAVDEVLRVLIPRQRIGVEDSTRVDALSNQRMLDTGHILTI